MTPNPNPSPELIEAITAAIGKADDAFGYSYRMTGLVDGVETHTLFMDGFEPVSFEDREDGSRLIAERRNRLRANGVLAAMSQTLPAQSPELIDEMTREIWDVAPIRTHAEARDLAETLAALSPQTLPAPGEVEHIADVGKMIEVERIRRAIWAYFHTLDDAAQSLPVVTFLSNRDVFLAQAIALATVAAANDEGVARAAVDTSEYRTDYQIGRADGIEAAAKVADDYEPFTGDPAYDAATDVAAVTIGAAIRLLSQGGGK